MTIIILSIMMMMSYDDNVFVWSCHSHNFIIFIYNIYFVYLFINFFYCIKKISLQMIIIIRLCCCYYHHNLCHLLFHLHCYYHQQHFHHHHHITSSTFNVSSIVTLYESSAPFLYANHQHQLYHLIYWSSSVSLPLIIFYWTLNHYHN